MGFEKKIVEELLQQYNGGDPDKWTKEMVETLKELAEDIPILEQFYPERVEYNPHTA